MFRRACRLCRKPVIAAMTASLWGGVGAARFAICGSCSERPRWGRRANLGVMRAGGGKTQRLSKNGRPVAPLLALIPLGTD